MVTAMGLQQQPFQGSSLPAYHLVFLGAFVVYLHKNNEKRQLRCSPPLFGHFLLGSIVH